MDKALTVIDARVLEALVRLVEKRRDFEWCRALEIKELGENVVLTPEEAAKWLEQDRSERARYVADAARFHGSPKHY